MGAHTVKIHRLINHIKPEAVSSSNLLNSNTDGAVFSEGANFFVLGNEKNQSSYAELVSVDTYNSLNLADLPKVLRAFLNDNDLNVEDIDIIIQGNNGDVKFDKYYNSLSEGLFAETPQVYYKHLCGEFNTASAFGLWLGARVLKAQRVPAIVELNDIKPAKIETILLYNQYRGENHSFTLLRKC